MTKYVCPEKIYKYTPLSGLRATLQGQSFKLSRPCDFNDPIDMYLQETIGDDLPNFLEDLKKEFHDYISTGIKNRPANNLHYQETLNFLHKVIDGLSEKNKEIFRQELLITPVKEMYDFDRLRRINDEITRGINQAFNSDGVFCSTVDNNNLLMWAHYADQYRGAVIEFEPSVEKDSVFLVSKPVSYSNDRPLPYKDAAAMVASLGMSSEDAIHDILERIIYTKSNDWAYEKEYRMFVPFLLQQPEKKFATLRFYPEELTSIYFGCRMNDDEMQEVRDLAQGVNPNVKLYRSIIAPREYRLVYEEYLG